MAEVGTVKMSAGSVMSGLTLRVKIHGLGVWRARVWLASRIMVASAWVLGSQIEIELKSDGGDYIPFDHGTPRELHTVDA